jgi:hypothetical protein
LRSGAQSAGFIALLLSGLQIWLRPGDGIVLWLHLAGGLMLLALLLPWVLRHIPRGLAHSQRTVFTQASWALLASYLIVIASGLVMALPALVWLIGPVWFLPRVATGALSFLHFWASWLTLGGLLLHLALRHWVWGRG